ncbi:hypothetical protein AAV32_05940 [Kerstersia gyiorum]|uniref:Uncharacterized protein n=1 Tax=Kerstersia gyiorum TaxID=206506 RepID=A0A171KUK4_9BURK|nr:hypothetical protein AAV32_05940 [Kerstersia gyiorum]
MYQLVGGYPQYFHQAPGFGNAVKFIFLFAQHDFQLQEITKRIDVVEMNAGAARKQQDSLFYHASQNAMRRTQHLAQGLWLRGWGNQIERGFRAGLVGTLVEDQFPVSVSELP